MKKFFALYAAFVLAAFVFIVLARGFFVAYAQTASSTVGSVTVATSTAALQAQIDANNQQITNLNQQIATYEAELKQVGADKKTLQQAINALDLQKNKVQAQVAATQHQIVVTQLQIQQLGGQIQDTKQTIATEQAALATEMLALQKADNQSPLVQLFSTGTIADVWATADAALQVQDAIQSKMEALQAQENTLADSQAASKQKQSTLTDQQQALTAQQQSLVSTEQSKAQLLAQTNAKESTYQKLLAAAQAELASFSAFAQNAGGSKLLGQQTVCDAWGCYYNQRDTAWGNLPLNGTQYKLASDGCLVASMAMIMTHYGYRDVTPVTINSNPDNFAVYYPAYLLTTINVDGVSATRKATTIDATLAAGTPLVVGIHAYGGTHFIVLVSGRAGNYIMRDPYIANGKDISFSANYSLRSIFAITKVQIGS